jgi:hypothetical protein
MKSTVWLKLSSARFRLLSTLHVLTGLVIALVAVACTSPPPDDKGSNQPTLDFDTYAKACNDALAEGNDNPIQWPTTLQCSTGPVLPITQNGLVIPAATNAEGKNFTNKTNCDRPPLLNISEGGLGQCVPNSTLQVTHVKQLGVGDRDEPVFALLCRNYKYRSLQAQAIKPEYDDVAMIAYSPKNKKTCFFQRLSDTRLQKLSRTSVFPPRDAISGVDIPSPFTPQGKGFWIPPSEVKDFNCARCHDANPFVRTPYVHQVTANPLHALPPRTSGMAYNIVSLDYFGQEWKTPHARFNIADRKDGAAGTCVRCHNLGPGSSGPFTEYSAGTPAPNQMASPDFQLTHWMPPDADRLTWNNAFGPSVLAMKACNLNPDNPECKKTPLD